CAEAGAVQDGFAVACGLRTTYSLPLWGMAGVGACGWSKSASLAKSVCEIVAEGYWLDRSLLCDYGSSLFQDTCHAHHSTPAHCPANAQYVSFRGHHVVVCGTTKPACPLCHQVRSRRRGQSRALPASHPATHV